MRRLQVDYLDRSDMFDVGLSSTGVDYSLPGQVLKIQRDVLNLLMSDAVAQRIIDSEVKLEDPKSGFRLSELYASLHRSIWSELKTGQEITPLRRNLQREHLARVANALVRAIVHDAGGRAGVTAPGRARAARRAQGRAGESGHVQRNAGAHRRKPVDARRGIEGFTPAPRRIGLF